MAEQKRDPRGDPCICGDATEWHQECYVKAAERSRSTHEPLQQELHLLAESMKHSAGMWMVPGWDGYKVADLLERARSALGVKVCRAEQRGASEWVCDCAAPGPNCKPTGWRAPGAPGTDGSQHG